MALPKSKRGFCLTSAAPLALAVLFGCSEKGGPAVGGGGGADGGYEPTPRAVGAPPAYWAVDRIEVGAAAGEGIAVLEDLGTLRTEARTLKSLPDGVKEGLVLTDGGLAGGALSVDEAAASARAARARGRFERLKAD